MAKFLLNQLQASLQNQEISFNISILDIELQIRCRDYSRAMHLLENLATRLYENEADLYQHVKLMTLKAKIYDKAGMPQKSFSVALRAASMAHRAKIFPALWEAVGAVCAVLNSLREFGAATKLLHSVIPQVLECEDCDLTAQIFSLLADAHVGMAGQVAADTLQRKEQLTKALENVDRAFDEFSRVEDMKGQREMMARKATIMHLNGDPVLANDYAAKCLDIKVTDDSHL